MGALQTAILADAPVGFWTLGETSGTTANDLSGNGYNGTYTLGYTLNQASLFNSASETLGSTQFDGSTGYVAASSGLSSAGWTGITVLCWLQFATAVNRTARVVSNSHTDADNNGFQLGINTSTGAGIWSIGNGTGQHSLFPSGMVLTANTPFAYFAKYDSTGSKPYSVWLNGSNIKSGTAGGTLTNGVDPLNIGRGAYANDYFTGLMGFVAVFNKPISDARLYQYYSLGQALGLLSATTQGDGTTNAPVLLVKHFLSATVQGDGTTTGALQVKHFLGATAQGDGAAHGSAQVSHRLTATAQGDGTTNTPLLLVSHRLSDTAQGDGTTNAPSLLAKRYMQATAQGDGVGSANLLVSHRLAAAAQGDGATNAALWVPARPGSINLSETLLSAVTLTDAQVA